MKKAKKRRGRPPKRKPTYMKRSERDALALRALIREACKTGMVEAIEHCSNFWRVTDGYKKYIDHQVATETEVLLAAVKQTLREELDRAAGFLVRRGRRK